MNYLNFDLYNLRAARAWDIPAVGDVRVRERGIRQCVTESRRVKTSLSSAPESGLLEVSTRLSLVINNEHIIFSTKVASKLNEFFASVADQFEMDSH